MEPLPGHVADRKDGENRMRKLLLAVLAAGLLFPGLALSQATHGFVFNWDDPVEREDGTALDPDEELLGYRMRCEGAESVERMIERNLTEMVDGQRRFEWVGAVQRGGWYDCQMTAIDVNELESDWSNVAQVRKLARPMPPGLRGMR